MATQIITRLLDDLDPEIEAERTVTFELDGKRFEVDLSPDHITDLMSVFQPYIEHGRKLTHTGKPVRRTTVASTEKTTNREFREQVRAWAREHGWPELSHKGRIPAEVYDAYDRARHQLQARQEAAQLGRQELSDYGGEGTPKTVEFRSPE